jgi:aquaporin Z
MRAKLSVEFIGTFFLCLGAILAQAPISVAAILCALIYMGGNVSGAHYNPAVTFAIWARGRITGRRAWGYVAVQLVAALFAALVAGLIHGHSEERAREIISTLGESAYDGVGLGCFGEYIGTFLLAFVILMVATSRLTAGNSYFGLAIALTVLGLSAIFAPLNMAFNPAVQITGSTYGLFSAFMSETSVAKAFLQEFTYFSHFSLRSLIDLSCQLLGGATAAWVFLTIFPEDR